jgi:hypothetical protein
MSGIMKGRVNGQCPQWFPANKPDDDKALASPLE